jgi:putrescine transport system substrate-binding protein
MRLTRRQTLATLGTTLALPWVRPSWAQAGTVNVYNWSDYIGETTLADFEAATGIGVVYDTYSSTEEMEAKLLAGSTGYDVCFTSGSSQPRMVTAGVYRALDRARLTGWGNLDPEILRVVDGWDAGSAHMAPYMWGSVGIAYNLDMVKERLPDADLQSLDLLFKPENAAALADCGISVLDSPQDVIPMVLRHLGLDGDTTNVADYDKVAEAFAAIRENITTFDNTNYLNAIPNGELCMINSWSGDYATAAARAAEAGIEMNLTYVVPKTGAPAWVDGMAMPSDAPNPDHAYAFLDFMLKPEVIAGCTNWVNYANANLASKPFVLPEILANPAIYPDAETMTRLWPLKPFNEEQDRALARIWSTIKSG